MTLNELAALVANTLKRHPDTRLTAVTVKPGDHEKGTANTVIVDIVERDQSKQRFIVSAEECEVPSPPAKAPKSKPASPEPTLPANDGVLRPGEVTTLSDGHGNGEVTPAADPVAATDAAPEGPIEDERPTATEATTPEATDPPAQAPTTEPKSTSSRSKKKDREGRSSGK